MRTALTNSRFQHLNLVSKKVLMTSVLQKLRFADHVVQYMIRASGSPWSYGFFQVKCWNLSENITSSQNNWGNERFQVIFPYLITKIAHIILSIHDIDTNIFNFHWRYSDLGCEKNFFILGWIIRHTLTKTENGANQQMNPKKINY